MIWPTDRLGAAYERLVNAWDGLALFRILLVGELRKGKYRTLIAVARYSG